VLKQPLLYFFEDNQTGVMEIREELSTYCFGGEGKENLEVRRLKYILNGESLV
jgi:thiamine pyrophosphokinase